MKRIRLSIYCLLGFAVLLGNRSALAQAVLVTASLDSTSVSVGQGTTLRVFAQVAPNVRSNANGIFSWYVDVVNTNGTVATANYAGMQKATSDKDPLTSSLGNPDGANRRGVYDTFLIRILSGLDAGVTNAIELMAIPVTGQVAGQTRFQVTAGSGVSALSSDFMVSPKTGEVPYTGGNYTSAFANLTVTGGGAACQPQLVASPLAGAGGPGGTLQLTFTPCPGRTHTVEYRAALGDVPGWLPLPGAPHNSGSVIVTNSSNYRFFRVRASLP